MTRSRFALFALASVPFFALAQAAYADGTGVSVVTGSPTGLGIELTQRLHPALNVRVGAGLSADADVEDFKIGSNKYTATFKFGGINALVDWHPWRGNFRLSGGVFTLRNDMGFERTKAPYVLDDVTYASKDLTALNGVSHLDQTVAPAFLVGWGNAAKRGRRVAFMVEAGVAWSGDVKTTLTAKGPMASDPALRQNLLDEAKKIDDDSPSVTGILRLGVSYRF